MLAAPLLILGCVGGGVRFEPGGHDARPEIEEILTDLRSNDAVVQTLQASGTLALRAPEFNAAQRLDGRLLFARPSAVYLEGRKVGALVIWMADSGTDALLVLPRKKRYYLAEGGSLALQGGEAFAPAALLHELFFAEGWTDVDPARVRLAEYDAHAGTAVLELPVDSPDAVLRRVILRGRPWVVVESKALDAEGVIVAVSRREDYVVESGVRLPRRIETEFPTRDAFLNLTVRRYGINEAPDEDHFDIGAHVRALDYEGYQRGVLAEEDLSEALP